ncbi:MULTISPECIES: carbohydrate ABC transporter permease [Moorena]|uniref:CUT1 family carbohydrate ABC transporter, TC 3.A.1.1.-, membrane protein 2 n=1 Tax=Moorena producens 3L TaxID=489825 RepID=F4XWF6_9CYAN|nr:MULTISPECIES: carbohydrate ABC transporter permease [Moorena]EGJ31141.1 CUT1 family carbohydrate ABC transporter, TC 3.A.1.1.-, membrane protein 2 [Moorena producens 3L]NEP67677.1 carbohydrate ABC transporter permease [Moorena sp. SIO3A5]OLT66177.1 sugar ABC transporter [Moorena producens 3L]
MPNSSSPQPKTKQINIIKLIILPLGIILLIIFCLAPLLWQFLTSIKVNQDISSLPNIYFPKRYTLDHYINLFTLRPLVHYIFNSTFVSITSTLLCLGIGTPAAYALARLTLRGEKIIIAGIIIITLFPFILIFLGLLELIKIIKLGNNYLSLIISYTAINLPLTLLVMRSFFQQLPPELEDAAKVDGYSTWQMLIEILLPLTVPALVTTGILTFIFAWNEFILALTFISQESMKTLPVAAAQLSGSLGKEIPYGSIAAMTVIGTFPLVVLVMFFQGKIVQGLTSGAVKG